MSESQAREERIKFREEQENRMRQFQDEKIEQTLAVFRKDFDGIQGLLKDKNPEAYKSLMFLRGKLRRFRNQWRAKLADLKVPENERNCLIGQINSVLLVFDLIESIQKINKELVPGHEKEILREKLFRPAQAQARNG